MHDHGGPALRYLLPPWQARARVAVYVPRPERLTPVDRSLLDELGVPVYSSPDRADRHDGGHAGRRIAQVAREHEADAITTVSEPYVMPVAWAAEALGLRGTSMAGAERTRDKLAMRDALRAAGFEVPRHRAVTGPGEVVAAFAELGGPLVLKPRRSMSAAGIQRVGRPRDAVAAFQAARKSLAGFDAVTERHHSFLVEELLVGDASRWYPVAGLSDQVCVEGVVVEGRYIPVAITDVTPKVPPFTQSGHVSPTSLAPEGQHRVVDAARRAVDGLGLSTCGTHVELKLMPDGSCAVIEAAARFPGRTVLPQTDYAYGTDLNGTLADALLHGRCTARPLVIGRAHSRAAATLYLYPSEYLRRLDRRGRRRNDGVTAYTGLEPMADLIGSDVRVAGFRERPWGWPVTTFDHEQSHWLAQLYLESHSLPQLRAAVGRIRDGFRPRTPPPSGVPTPIGPGSGRNRQKEQG